MNERTKKAIDIQESIRHILFYEWDPIGVNDLALDDEYDSYVGGIYRLLASGASDYQIIEHLHRLGINKMNVNCSREKLKNVAEKLMKLNVSL